jgi:hypothetical protein
MRTKQIRVAQEYALILARRARRAGMPLTTYTAKLAKRIANRRQLKLPLPLSHFSPDAPDQLIGGREAVP